MNLWCGVDAAALGMANAVVASTKTMSIRVGINGGLSNLRYQISLMHANYFANITQYDYIAYASYR
jgi:hypothetical protein